MMPQNHNNFLKNAVEILKSDPRIVGIATGGSYITDEMDEYSDVDLIIGIDDTYYDSIMNHRYEIAEKLGCLLSAFTGEHVGEPRLLICLYGPELLHVDLKFVSLCDIEQRVEEPCILWERNNCISEALKVGSPQFPVPSLQWIEDRFWVWIHYGATKIGRGEIFEAIDFISSLRQMVIGPLILMKNGKLPKGVRKIEFYAPESVISLKETIPSYNFKSCIKSLNSIIEMYLELRENFITDSFEKRVDAEIHTINYLNNIANKLI